MARRRWVWLVSGLAGAAVLTQRGRRVSRRMFHIAGQRARYLSGRARGVRYRLSGEHPSPDVDLRTLADRVRSELGPLEKRLDLPHVHVMTENHVVLLHGVVGTEREADEVEAAVQRVVGVAGVESYLHIGLLTGDTRPSRGRSVEQPSEALNRLLAAARDAGADERTDQATVRAVLATLAEHLPEDEREHLLSHLPADVRRLTEPPRRHGRAPKRLRHVSEFVAATGADSIDPTKATQIVESILGALRQLVPDEAEDISAVLSAELKEFWRSAQPL